MSVDHFEDFPSWQLMNFSRNCTIWGDWLGVVLAPDPSLDTTVLIGPAIQSGLALFITALPDNATAYQGNMSVTEVYTIISEWYTYNMFYSWEGNENQTEGAWNINSDFIKNVVVQPALQCPDEFCHAMAYVGNADLTGIGVFISYLVEALFVTAYLFAFTGWHIRGYFKAKKRCGFHDTSLKPTHSTPTGLSAKLARLSLPRSVLDSFRSLDGFLSAAMLICLAMLCASLYLDGQGLKARDNPKDNSLKNFNIISNVDYPFHSTTPYDMILSFLASCFSVFPVLLLYALKGRRSHSSSGKEGENHPEDKRGVWMRRCFMIVIWILVVVEVFLSPRGNLDYAQRNSADQDANIDPCNHRGGTVYWQAMQVAGGLVIAIPLLWMFITALLLTGFGIPGVVSNRWIRRWRTVWRLGVAWVNLMIMRAIFFYFASLRIEIIHSAGAGDAQNTWGFGQVLALATWVPTVAEFGYIFIWGLEEGLDSHMPSGFEVQRVNSGLDIDADASVGPDPYEMQQMPLTNEKHITLPSNHNPSEPYPGGGQTLTSGHVTDAEGQITPDVYYGDSVNHQRQTPAQHFDSTGW